jgi:YbbR domain-containing protein
MSYKVNLSENNSIQVKIDMDLNSKKLQVVGIPTTVYVGINTMNSTLRINLADDEYYTVIL